MTVIHRATRTPPWDVEGYPAKPMRWLTLPDGTTGYLMYTGDCWTVYSEDEKWYEDGFFTLDEVRDWCGMWQM